MNIDDRVRDACHRIEELYHETNGKCYVSFSGGKDSTVLLALIKLCEEVYTIPENGIPAVYSDTGIELGATSEFVRWVKNNWYPNVQIIRPDVSFDWILKNKGKPIRSKVRSEYIHRWNTGNRSDSCRQNLIDGITNTGKHATRTKLADRDMHFISPDFDISVGSKCCFYLKKKPFLKYAKENDIKGYLYGIRQDEGGARSINIEARKSKDKNAKICTAIDSKGMIKKAPIIDWSNEDINEFVNQYNVPLSKAYTVYGLERTGCMGCPFAMSIAKNLEVLHEYEPNRYKASMHWLKDVYIAQNVELPFDEAYEREREREWRLKYEPMRQEMLRKYRPNSRLITDGTQLSLFDEEEEE